MKKLILICIVIGLWGSNLIQAQEEIPTTVFVALDHLNEYLLYPIELTDEGVEWYWETITLNDFGDDCRERADQSIPLPTVAFDIHFYRLSETYHYRVSMDEQLVVPCVDIEDISENSLPAVTTALADLNRRLHFNFTPNDLPWRWQETQFDDYTLDCPTFTPPDETFDQSMDGYIVHFTVLGQNLEYRVSEDRLIVILCDPEILEA